MARPSYPVGWLTMRLNLTEIEARLDRATVFHDGSYFGEAAALLRALRETRAALRVMVLNKHPSQEAIDDAREVLRSVDD